MELTIDEQMAILMRGVDYGDPQIKENMEKELRERLIESQETGRPLRVYLGVDPTAPDLHLGHTVPMRKLRQFQDLGHECIFLIGNFTGLIGDPSDKDSARRQMTPEELEENARTYVEQAFRILDPERTIIKYNAEWLAPLTFADIIKLASNFTVQQFLARENFAKRIERGDPIWLHEFLYGLMQGYDAVALQTDVQIGGVDQLFNLLAGRKLQEYFGQRPQVIITLPILVGTDGKLRMSKTTGNAIGINEPPEEMYGKIMSIPDSAMLNYFNLLTRYTPAQIAEIEEGLQTGQLHPRDVKMQLAREIVSIFHGEEAVGPAEEHFKRVFQQRQLPEEMPEYRLSQPEMVLDVLVGAGLVSSRSEGRRLIRQGGVRLDGQVVQTIDTAINPDREHILQVGRRRFVRIVSE
ncbi:MAG TPA: tyrosine--tRNA ligase [Caldilineae bacterium]|jgi:tyrosyl-tRNA synthetase|nr:tyrosine--tRNA ligase [Caldilineae bacterium]